MNEVPALSESEYDLIVELLEREQHDLPAEIHHTRTRTFRNELRERLRTAGVLLDKLRGLNHEHARHAAC